MSENTHALIESAAKELMEKMGFPCQVKVIEQNPSSKESDGTIICDITVETDSHILIGQYGVNLQALQHIARLIVRKQMSDKINFIVDVNSYRQEKNDSIVELARETAEQALQERRAIVMKPMTAYERRLVHIELAKNVQVATESIGEGEDRKIIVKPSDTI